MQPHLNLPAGTGIRFSQSVHYEYRCVLISICWVVTYVLQHHANFLTAMACMGYVSGFTYGVSYKKSFAEAKTSREAPAPFCIPDGVEHVPVVFRGREFFLSNAEHRRKKAFPDVSGMSVVCADRGMPRRNSRANSQRFFMAALSHRVLGISTAGDGVVRTKG